MIHPSLRRTIALALSLASGVGAATVLDARVALAGQDPPSQETVGAEGPDAADHTGGLVQQAQKLSSVTANQKTQLQQLVTERRTASAPVRQANAKLLNQLAQQVEQTKLDQAALDPAAHGVDDAARTAMPKYEDTVNRLHGLLTPAQRNELVDQVEAQAAQRKVARGSSSSADAGAQAQAAEGEVWAKLDLTDQQKSQVMATLQAGRAEAGADGGGMKENMAAARDFLDRFRNDDFDAHSFNLEPHPGERETKFAAAVLPVLSPTQRTTFADFLRDKASRS